MTALELKHQEKLRRWSEMVGECRSSRSTVKRWCKEHGITPSTYYRWEGEVLSKAKQAEEPSSAVSFAAVPVPKHSYRNVLHSLFLFCGRRRDRIKALYWEGNGFILLYKRFE